MREYLNPVLDVLDRQLFVLGQTRITPLSIIYLLLLSAALIYLSGKLRDLLIQKLLQRTPLKSGARQAIGTISRYLILFIGFILILQTVGIDLTAFNVLAGAVGIGIGLGLQNIANNFISGLIILLERPIQVGDRIDVAGVTGRVVSIGARSTRVLTNDNIAIIIPNSKFVTENVVNWSYENETVRFKIPIMVVHEADIREVERLMLEAARANDDVAEKPAPSVRFVKIDEEGLYFELRAWSTKRLHKPTVFKSDLRFAIVERLNANNIRMSRNQARDNDREPAAGTSNGTSKKRSRERNELPIEA